MLLVGLTALVSVVGASTSASAPESPEGPAIRSVLRIIHGPSPLDTFRRPRALAADSARGIFLVADTGNRRLVTFDANGRSRGMVRLDPTAAGDGLVEPQAVALDRRGRIFVVDALSAEIEVLSSTGSHLGHLEPPLPPELMQETQPKHIAIGQSGRIYLLFSGARSGLLVMEADGTLVSTLGFDPPGTGAWVGPVCVAVNPDESEMVILDPTGRRAILVYDADGELRAAFGEHGEGDGTFSMAAHVSWGPEGNLWVTDTIRHSVSVLDPRGRYLGRIGGFGSAPGEFSYPAASTFLARDQLLVLERAGARCQLIALELPEGGGVPAPRPDLVASDP